MPDTLDKQAPGYRHGSGEAQQIAERGLVLRCLVGSGVHGIKVGATDDRDEMGMCIEPPEYVVGLRQVWVPALREHIDFEQYVYRTQPEGRRSGPGDLDYTAYSLRKWMRLALQGNPTMLLPLFVPEHDILAISAPGRELREMAASVILSRHAGERFMGYLRQQRGRLLGELGGKDCNRAELVEAYGYDTKYAAHMVRLGVQGLELIETGRITLPVPEPWRSWLVELRLGQHSQDEALAEAKRLEDAIGNLLPYSPLPPEPDRRAADEWLIRTYQETWKAWAG